MHRSFLGFAVLSLALSVAACGDDNDANTADNADTSGADVAADAGGADGADTPDVTSVAPVETASGELGAEGGTLEAGAATLTIPAGALSATVEVTVEDAGDDIAALPEGASASSPAVAVTPHGQTFAAPITLTLPYTGTGDTVLRLVDEADDVWEVVPGATFGEDTVAIETTTFSIYIVVSRCAPYCAHASTVCGISQGTCQSQCTTIALRGPQTPACTTAQQALMTCYGGATATDLECTTGVPLAATCAAERAAAAVACGVAAPGSGGGGPGATATCPCFTYADLEAAYGAAEAFNASATNPPAQYGNGASDWGMCTYTTATWGDVDDVSTIWFASALGSSADDAEMNWEGNFSAGLLDGDYVCAIWSEQAGVPGVGGPATGFTSQGPIADVEAQACVDLLVAYAGSKSWTCGEQR